MGLNFDGLRVERARPQVGRECGSRDGDARAGERDRVPRCDGGLVVVVDVQLYRVACAVCAILRYAVSDEREHDAGNAR